MGKRLTGKPKSRKAVVTKRNKKRDPGDESVQPVTIEIKPGGGFDVNNPDISFNLVVNGDTNKNNYYYDSNSPKWDQWLVTSAISWATGVPLIVHLNKADPMTFKSHTYYRTNKVKLGP